MKRFIGSLMSVGAMAGAVFGSAQGAMAADVSAYAARKGRIYTQSSAAAPAPAQLPFLFIAYLEGDLDVISEAYVSTPSAFASQLALEPNDISTRLEVQLPVDSQNNLNLFAPSGQYTFTIDSDNDGFSVAPIRLDATAFPAAIPQISNFAAAQAIDPDADFTLSFNAFTGAGPNDQFELEIADEFGVFYTEVGSGSSVVIPSGMLMPGTSYEARLRFVQEAARDTTTYPGALGTTALFNETQFTINTSGEGGGGGDDTTAPTLLFNSPQSGTADYPVNGSVTFLFSESMVPTESIEWSANVNTSGLSYSWINDGQMLVVSSRGAFPPDSTITWKLNPTAGNPANFRDQAGNPLAVAAYQGTFSTGAAGSDDPCDPTGGVDDGRGFGSLFKTVHYEQTGNNAPVLDPELAASFGATYRGATNQSVSAVSVSGPNGTINLTNMFGFYLASLTYNSAAALDAAIPAGNYTITATGAGTATLPVGLTTQVPVPKINNLTSLAGMDVTKDFTLTFAPFTGAGASDGIFISISGSEGQGEFYAPDLCRNIQLPNTATSVVIPANTFKAGQTYSGSITFSRSSFDTNSIPSTVVSAGASVTTSFGFTSGGGSQAREPMWNSPTRNADGTITFTITGDAGTTVVIEAADAVTGPWTALSSQVLAAGSYQLVIDPKTSARQFFRARVQ